MFRQKQEKNMNGKLAYKMSVAALIAVTLSANAELNTHYNLTRDSLIVFSGETLRYTVDTPEDSGLVSTMPTVNEILANLKRNGAYRLVDKNRNVKTDGVPADGDILEKLDAKGKVKSRYKVGVSNAALAPSLTLNRDAATVGALSDIVIDFNAGQRSPMTTVDILIPSGIDITLDNTTINVIGRGETVLRNLPKQSIGRTGTNYSYNRVGDVELTKLPDGTSRLHLSSLDLRPFNGIDIRLKIKGVKIPEAKDYVFSASYIASEPKRQASPVVNAALKGQHAISDFTRVPLRRATYVPDQDYLWTAFEWSPVHDAEVTPMYSSDGGKTWNNAENRVINSELGELMINRLEPDKLYAFKLNVADGKRKGDSNIVWFRTGMWDARDYGVKGDGTHDDTDKINELIALVNSYGGGTIKFPAGNYPVRTVRLLSNVWLYVDSGAIIQALPGADAPEPTWFSDRAYRSGLSPTDPRPYKDPENYLTKQDVGHTFFHNTMFFGERIENVKIIGTGRITGNGNIVTTDRVMNNEPEKRCDKMFTFKLCKDIEIGGIETGREMWYDEALDKPYYFTDTIGPRIPDYSDAAMLHIDQGGHFVLLATGTDGIYVHDTYFGKYNTKNARDIYDFMACNDVKVHNIYSKVSSDDIVKPGSDCSLGFTRPVSGYWVRNIVGDTNCNLFQIGSETADDIQNLYVDNIYVLGANKAGFSISTNDGAHVKNVYLNSGKTGSIHSRSVMKRTRAPFFISISNRGRVLGADVEMFTFNENGNERKELLVTNSNIGKVENIFINGVDISEVYGGSSFRGDRWKAYDGSQNEAAAIIAGFKLPDAENITSGRSDFKMPDGRHTGYITNISFNDVNMTVKGGHPDEDSEAFPPEIGVGRYNVGDLKIQPAFGFWFRHVENATLDNCSLNAEKADGRHPVYMDDVQGSVIRNLSVVPGINDRKPVFNVRSNNITEL